MPSLSNPGLHGVEWTRKRTFLLVYKESLPNTEAFGVSDVSNIAADRDRCLEISWPQLSYWGSNNSSTMWPTRFTDKSVGGMEECSLYRVHLDSKRETALSGRQSYLTMKVVRGT